ASQVREAVEAFAPVARSRHVAVRAALEHDIVSVVDPGALRQILLNLLDNAVKYGPQGQTITAGTGVGRDGRAQIWVDDEGTGIAAGDQARIWEPFRRLDGAVEAGISGNGIGLAVVRELVLAQGGAVSVHDAPGGGARFLVTLRCASPRLACDVPAPVSLTSSPAESEVLPVR
ncbi:MAG TPA: HAMP domain-containing sensor histidine kinase, partial [Gemmatimonadaceae bacterium]|nr:HAMP domain-containing sensor histidine kinase [Gemmatimonadaceae bacterium]